MHRSGRYASLREGLVGAWCPSVSGSFGYSLPDISGYGNNGKLTNMDPPNDWVTSGGKTALDFDGSNDFVNLNTTLLTNTKTASLWVQFRTTPNSVLIGTSTSPDSSYLIYVDSTNIYTKRQSSFYYTAHGGFTLSVWYHVLIVSDGANISFYKNGKSIGSYVDPLTVSWSSIGAYPSSAFSLNGSLDDIRIYKRALTPAEIQLLYTGGRGVGLIQERRRWFYTDPAGTASVTTGAATCSGSATHTTPTYTATSAITIGAATASGSATFATAVFLASGAVTVGAATASGTATFVAPVYTGTSALTVGAATASASGTVTHPVYTGSAAVTVGAATCSVS